MRLVWFNDDGKVVEDKSFKELRQEQISLQLNIANADADKRKWTCGLFYQNTLKVLIPYELIFLQHNDDIPSEQIIIIIGIVASLLFIILAVVLFLGICKRRGWGNQTQRSPQSKRKAKGKSQPSSTSGAIQQKPDTDDIHYGSINFQVKGQTGTDDIHYGSINFQDKGQTGRRDGKSPSNQETDMYLAPLRNDDSSVIYAQVTQTKKK
ncbi:uncharacterized protein LOC144599914 isoform X1 [Rhinoraja longicauda]